MAKDRQISLMHAAFGGVRVIQRNGNEFWFVAKDVCEVIEHSNYRMAVEGLDEDEKGVTKVYTPSRNQHGACGTQETELIIISESGLYTLLIRSNKPQAAPFRRWVTKEVLPNIRKYGSYSTDPARMGRIIKEAGKKSARQLFGEIDRRTSKTDKNRIKKLAGVDDWYMGDVLNAETEDPALVAMLTGRALDNEQLRPLFYTVEGATALLGVLKNYGRVMGRKKVNG